MWNVLLDGLQQIPAKHCANLPLWLDHFDSLWLVVSHAVPSATAFGVKPEVSLYDHSKATAALATALWRWHHESERTEVAALHAGWDDEKFLLVQGEFFGIQDFIFAEGGKTQKNAHKLLRGRSFQVSLLAECAALKLLEALELPPTSQIVNAAGKFLLVAPNTPNARAAVRRCRQEIDAWCLKVTYGQIGVGLAATPATCNDFRTGGFKELNRRLFAELGTAKHRRFDLCAGDAPTLFDGYLDAFDPSLDVCQIDGCHPADAQASKKRDYPLSTLADDQIRIGEELTRRTRLLVVRDADRLPVLGLDYFGYRLAIVRAAEDGGDYGNLARQGVLRRIWDFDAAAADGTIWHGYARRFVNSYVPRFSSEELQVDGKYGPCEDPPDFRYGAGDDPCRRAIKTLQHLACEDRRQQEGDSWRGEIALVTIKGDIDNLGQLFQDGLDKPTFAKMASLSRQINAFFALWLPWYCEFGVDDRHVARYRNTYTVFAGGDDFFLIGPWESTVALAGTLRAHFAAYVVNARITLSCGLSMTHPQAPVRQLAHGAEEALGKAKNYPETGTRQKDAVTFWQQTVSWEKWRDLMTTRREELEDLIEEADRHGARMSAGLTYALLQLAECSASRHPQDAIWRSRLHYLLARFFRDRLHGDDAGRERGQALAKKAIGIIGDALNVHRSAYRLPLSVILYRLRE